jgi:hypothetical protein
VAYRFRFTTAMVNSSDFRGLSGSTHAQPGSIMTVLVRYLERYGTVRVVISRARDHASCRIAGAAPLNLRLASKFDAGRRLTRSVTLRWKMLSS